MNTENHYQETDLGNISLNPRGEYNPEESYEYLDLVVLEGGSYVCLAENGATITGISPESGKTTQYWQVITIPGSLTPEYIAMHDRVVNLSEQVGADAVEVRTAEQNVSGMELNVTQMQEQTRQSAEAAEQSKDSSAGYAASADASRQAAEESKQNIDAQVTGFDNHVAEKTGEAENDIEAARIAANKAIIAQQEQSVNEVARAGIEAISTAQSAAQTATEKAQAAATSEKNAAASETAAKLSEENATKMAEQVATDKEQVAYDRTAVENAKQEMTGSVAQIEQNTQGISELKSDLSNSKKAIAELADKKITKFYTNSLGETTLNDSDNGKIQDMMMYGKSEQKSYSGKNLFKAKNEDIITVTCDGLSLNGTANFHQFINFTIPAGSYFIGEMNGDRSIHSYIDDFDTFMCDVGAITFETDKTLNFYISQGTYSNILIKPYIVEGSNPMETYEPYVGGIPSPNPDYPQEIKSVVGPSVKVCGKNLYNCNSLSLYDLGLKDGEKYYISFSKPIGRIKISIESYSSPSDILYSNDVKTGAKRFEFTYNSAKQWNLFIWGTDGTNILDIIPLSEYGSYEIMLSKNGYSEYKPYVEPQTATLPYTLNAIPVSDGGNVTIDGQEYIADYVDVERGKLVRMVDSSKLDNTQSIVNKTEWLLAEPQEIGLTQEETQTLKTLATYYPTTNISVNSEQLDGYTVFNYPISMENGWNYVKQQIGDTREYIYDIDARTQDTDLQAAEAYVNSEYAVTLTELGV